MSKLHGAIERAAKQVDAKKEALDLVGHWRTKLVGF